jgi:hypothetical protein
MRQVLTARKARQIFIISSCRGGISVQSMKNLRRREEKADGQAQGADH